MREALGSGSDFPYRALVQGLASRGRTTDFSDNNFEAVLETGYGKRTCFLALSLLYDPSNWGATQHHIDHVMPRSLADRKALVARSLPEHLIQRIADSVNRLGNLQLLLGRENLEKSDMPFAQWIQTRDGEFLDRHLIPNDPALWDVTALPEFVEAREELIRQRLQRLDSNSSPDNESFVLARGHAVGN